MWKVSTTHLRPVYASEYQIENRDALEMLPRVGFRAPAGTTERSARVQARQGCTHLLTRVFSGRSM